MNQQTIPNEPETCRQDQAHCSKALVLCTVWNHILEDNPLIVEVTPDETREMAISCFGNCLDDLEFKVRHLTRDEVDQLPEWEA